MGMPSRDADMGVEQMACHMLVTAELLGSGTASVLLFRCCDTTISAVAQTTQRIYVKLLFPRGRRHPAAPDEFVEHLGEHHERGRITDRAGPPPVLATSARADREPS
jgi:hypothetical protein